MRSVRVVVCESGTKKQNGSSKGNETVCRRQTICGTGTREERDLMRSDLGLERILGAKLVLANWDAAGGVLGRCLLACWRAGQGRQGVALLGCGVAFAMTKVFSAGCDCCHYRQGVCPCDLDLAQCKLYRT